MEQLELQLEGFGLFCPVCSSNEHRVTQTLIWEGMITRKRKCENGHTFTTEERVSTSKNYNLALKVLRATS